MKRYFGIYVALNKPKPKQNKPKGGKKNA